MAEIIVKYNTVDKKLEATKDGKALVLKILLSMKSMIKRASLVWKPLTFLKMKRTTCTKYIVVCANNMIRTKLLRKLLNT